MLDIMSLFGYSVFQAKGIRNSDGLPYLFGTGSLESVIEATVTAASEAL